MDQPVAALPTPAERLVANILATGHGGGHDLHLRTLRAKGVTLAGHFLGAMDGRLQFAPDLGESMAWGDERHRRLMDLVRKVVAERGLPPIEIPDPQPFDPRAPEELGLTGFGAVIFAGGFRPAYRKWLPWPDAFDDLGFPIQRDGASTVVDGLDFRASISCASGSRRSCSASAKTRRSWPGPSPSDPGRKHADLAPRLIRKRHTRPRAVMPHEPHVAWGSIPTPRKGRRPVEFVRPALSRAVLGDYSEWECGEASSSDKLLSDERALGEASSSDELLSDELAAAGLICDVQVGAGVIAVPL
jgi:hypothetical protein